MDSPFSDRCGASDPESRTHLASMWSSMSVLVTQSPNRLSMVTGNQLITFSCYSPFHKTYHQETVPPHTASHAGLKRASALVGLSERAWSNEAGSGSGTGVWGTVSLAFRSKPVFNCPGFLHLVDFTDYSFNGIKNVGK